MEKLLCQAMPEKDRWEYLKDKCDAVETIGYRHHYTEAELSKKKDALAEVSIEINDIEKEKKDAMDEYKDRLKPLNETKGELLDKIKERSEYRDSEPCAKMINYDERKVGYYNSIGELVYERAIEGEERQRTIFNINRKTGTES